MIPFTAVCLSAALVATVPAPDLVTAAGAPPVHVAACRTVVERHGRGAPAQEAIQVSFSNDHDLAADVAQFSVRSSTGQWRNFTARGSFSKGVIIADRILPAENASEEHAFGREQGVDCELTYVHFVDGSTWTAAP